MMNLTAIHEFRAPKHAVPLSSAPASRESFNRADNPVVVPAQRKWQAVAEFGGQKTAAVILGAALGMMDATGEPIFGSTAADPNGGVGLVFATAAGLSLVELALLWSGHSPSKHVDGAFGNFLDGALTGSATTAVGIWSYKQGNLYQSAKASGGTTTTTKGFEPDYNPTRQFAPAPMRDHVAPETVAAARDRIKHDPHAAFF